MESHVLKNYTTLSCKTFFADDTGEFSFLTNIFFVVSDKPWWKCDN